MIDFNFENSGPVPVELTWIDAFEDDSRSRHTVCEFNNNDLFVTFSSVFYLISTNEIGAKFATYYEVNSEDWVFQGRFDLPWGMVLCIETLVGGEILYEKS